MHIRNHLMPSAMEKLNEVDAYWNLFFFSQVEKTEYECEQH